MSDHRAPLLASPFAAGLVGLGGTPQARVLDFCKPRPVFTLAQLQAELRLAGITIRRALKALGYLCSFNHNARYYTLADRPQFAANGLLS